MSFSQLTAKAKCPKEDQTPTQQEEVKVWAGEDATYRSRPSSSFAPSSFGVMATIAAILDQIHLLRDDIGEIRELQTSHDARLVHLTNEMCQKKTCIRRITRCQSCLGGFIPSPKLVALQLLVLMVMMIMLLHLTIRLLFHSDPTLSIVIERGSSCIVVVGQLLGGE